MSMQLEHFSAAAKGQGGSPHYLVASALNGAVRGCFSIVKERPDAGHKALAAARAWADAAMQWTSTAPKHPDAEPLAAMTKAVKAAGTAAAAEQACKAGLAAIEQPRLKEIKQAEARLAKSKAQCDEAAASVRALDAAAKDPKGRPWYDVIEAAMIASMPAVNALMHMIAIAKLYEKEGKPDALQQLNGLGRTCELVMLTHGPDFEGADITALATLAVELRYAGTLQEAADAIVTAEASFDAAYKVGRARIDEEHAKRMSILEAEERRAAAALREAEIAAIKAQARAEALKEAATLRGTATPGSNGGGNN